MAKNVQTLEEMFAFLVSPGSGAVTATAALSAALVRRNCLFADVPALTAPLRTCLETHLDLNRALTVDSVNLQACEESFFRRGVHAGLDEVNQRLSDATDQLEALRVYLNGVLSQWESAGKRTSSASASASAAAGTGTEYLKLYETDKNHLALVGTKRRCQLLATQWSTKGMPAGGGKGKGNGNGIVLQYASSWDAGAGTTTTVQWTWVAPQEWTLVPQGASNYALSCPSLDALCQSMTAWKQARKELLQTVYHDFLDKVETEHYETLGQLVDWTTQVDVALAKAAVAKKYHYCQPTVVASTDSFVQARGLRHALIEHLQQNETYVTNDVEVGGGAPRDRGILLFGTNSVGKTSLIRALGIAVVMAQAGFFVPATQFTLSPYHSLFTRILGNDNIFKGLSSFAVEISELRTILRLANARSLILGDELCSGTENISAISIFVTGIRSLYEKQSSFLFATHLHEIVDMEEIRSLTRCAVKHLRVIYDREKDALVYDRKLQDGSGDNMYGLEVCKSLHLPADFLEEANEVRMKYFPEARSLLSLKTSHFNARKIMGLCEECGRHRGTEVHHVAFQRDAGEDGFIEGERSVFHKNHVANLRTLCEECHQAMHH
jgi:DNA mismatch repair protein MutS